MKNKDILMLLSFLFLVAIISCQRMDNPMAEIDYADLPYMTSEDLAPGLYRMVVQSTGYYFPDVDVPEITHLTTELPLEAFPDCPPERIRGIELNPSGIVTCTSYQLQVALVPPIRPKLPAGNIYALYPGHNLIGPEGRVIEFPVVVVELTRFVKKSVIRPSWTVFEYEGRFITSLSDPEIPVEYAQAPE